MDTPLEPAQTSSPQTPSSLPPIRYFDMLPPELLEDIFDQLIPTDRTVATYLERRQTVPSLCLVSKRFYQLAHPALATALWLKGSQGLEIQTGKSHLWNHCRWLWLDMPNLTPEVKTNLEDIVRVATRIEAVACGGSASLINVVCASHLTKLHLSYVRLPLGFVFASPTLKQLSLREVQFPNQENLVHDLPSLRHLGYSLRSGVMDNNHRRFIASLVPQLHTICRPLTDDTEWESVPSILSYCTLIQASSFSQQRQAKVQNLRITAWRGVGEIGNFQEQSASASLQEWTHVLSSPNCSLPTLYLPSNISSSNPFLAESVRSAIDALEALCQQRKVEIVYDYSITYHAMDSLIPQDFVRRVEKRV